MAWLKLPNAGDSATIVIKQCGEHKSPSGDLTIRFDSRNEETIYLPRLVGEHWLRELGCGRPDGSIDYDKALGRTLKFSRVAAPVQGDRPHWKVEAVREVVVFKEEKEPVNEHLPPGTGKPSASVVELQREARKRIVDAYQWANHVALTIQQENAKGKPHLKPTAESIQEGVTTLMYRAERMNAI